MILHVVLTVALGIGSQAIITTITPPTHLHLTTQNLNSKGTHQHGRIGDLDFGLELLLVV